MPANNSLPLGQEAASPPASINLNSNNPFRNRAASPASLGAAFSSPASPFDDPAPARPLSRNPFLDQTSGAPLAKTESSPQNADDFFQSLSLEDKKISGDKRDRPTPSRRPMEPRQGDDRPPPGGSNSKHRPTKSQEEALRARRMQSMSRRPDPGPSRSPQRKQQPPPPRRPRRNSDSSVMDFDAGSLTSEERKLIEAHRAKDRARREREREARDKISDRKESRDPKEARDSKDRREARDNRSSRDKDGKEKGKSGRPSRRMDIIDQLDATSIFGTGLFHHDGPFDALNPNRNKSSRRAPMQAFPKDSLNNALGGFGPVNAQPDHATFMGHGTEEAFRDYAKGSCLKPQISPAIFDPTSKGEMVHGDESYGLGTSTFLEGTPAAKTAIAKHEHEQSQAEASGLQRKKSLAQRIRHINRGPRDFNAAGRGGSSSGDAAGMRSPPTGGSAGANAGSENPFFAEFGKGEEVISVRQRDGAMSPSSPPPPKPRPRGGSHNGLERRATTDATPPGEEPLPKPSGLLGRMKSLKSGKKRAPETYGNASANANAGNAL